MKTLHSVEETSGLIQDGKTLLLAGDEALLAALPKGNWIGGTIPYFMGDEGGITTKEKIHVRELEDSNKLQSIRAYGAEELSAIPEGYAENGVSFIIVPAFSEAHVGFAKNAMSFDGIFDSPLVGWVSGVHLDEFGEGKVPKVYNGLSGEENENKAVVMHTSLPDDTYAKIEIINIFSDEGATDVITFPTDGNVVTECKVNGETTTLADYLKKTNHDVQLPLIGDFMSAKLNVSIQTVDEEKKEVVLYAPVFSDIEYKLSKPVADYATAFANRLETVMSLEAGFTCNCVLNFLYGNLEGKKTGKMTGPMTFGEIAYMLLNQTLVYCEYLKK